MSRVRPSLVLTLVNLDHMPEAKQALRERQVPEQVFERREQDTASGLDFGMVRFPVH
jgi:hypothetical protein